MIIIIILASLLVIVICAAVVFFVLNNKEKEDDQVVSNNYEYHYHETDDHYNENDSVPDQFNYDYFESYENDFILPYSATEKYTKSDFYLMELSEYETTMAINEIYARHGRIFDDYEFKSYYESCDWYTGIYEADEFDDSVFNTFERHNLDELIKYSKEKGWR